MHCWLFPHAPLSSQLGCQFTRGWFPVMLRRQTNPCLRKECCLQAFTGARSAAAGISASIPLSQDALIFELSQVLPSWPHVHIYHQAPALALSKNISWDCEFPILVWSQCSPCGKSGFAWFLWSAALVPVFWAFPAYKQGTKCPPAVGLNSTTSFWTQCWRTYTMDAHRWSNSH